MSNDFENLPPDQNPDALTTLLSEGETARPLPDETAPASADEMATTMELMFKPETLLKLASQRMPFGKYQGRVLIDLPEPYVVWFVKKGLPSGELGELLALLYEIKLNGLESLLDPLRRPDYRF